MNSRVTVCWKASMISVLRCSTSPIFPLMRLSTDCQEVSRRGFTCGSRENSLPAQDKRDPGSPDKFRGGIWHGGVCEYKTPRAPTFPADCKYAYRIGRYAEYPPKI